MANFLSLINVSLDKDLLDLIDSCTITVNSKQLCDMIVKSDNITDVRTKLINRKNCDIKIDNNKIHSRVIVELVTVDITDDIVMEFVLNDEHNTNDDGILNGYGLIISNTILKYLNS